MLARRLKSTEAIRTLPLIQRSVADVVELKRRAEQEARVRQAVLEGRKR